MGLKDKMQHIVDKAKGEDGALGQPEASHPSEQDVPADPEVASSRATGGEHEGTVDEAGAFGDATSVTGTGETGDFVGRVAGDDPAYAGETGAEARRAAE
jgi:hypothetical protein